MTRLRVWPPPAYAAAAARPVRRPPFPLEQPGVQLYAQARQALQRCLPAVGLSPGDEVLVPSYHHGSEIEGLVRAGLVVRAYEVGPDLQPPVAELDALVGPRTRALHLVHHLGFPQDAARWRRWCDDRGLLLVEDAAQAWLATRDGVPVGTHGDLAVFCLYKTLGLPDGAAVVGRAPLPAPDRRGVTGARHLSGRLAGAALARAGRARTGGEYDQAADLAVPVVTRGPALATRLLLPRASAVDARAARRRAYGVLLGALPHLVPVPFAVLPDGASPFAFPLAVEDKADALRRLTAAGVEGLDLWCRAHPLLPDRPGGRSAWLRRHVLCLPVHQDLTDDDLAVLVTAAGSLAPARELTAEHAVHNGRHRAGAAGR